MHPALVLGEVTPLRTEGQTFSETLHSASLPLPLTLVWTRLIDIFLTGHDPRLHGFKL